MGAKESKPPAPDDAKEGDVDTNNSSTQDVEQDAAMNIKQKTMNIKQKTKPRPIRPPTKWRDYDQGLSTENITMRIPTNYKAQSHVLNAHGEDSLEHIVLDFLHQRWVQVTLAVLLLLDVLILFTELALGSIYPNCHFVERDAISCCGNEVNPALFADSSNDICPADLQAMDTDLFPAGCDDYKWHRVNTAKEVLFFATVTILSIFLLENFVTMWALKPRIYFRQIFYVLDLVVVSVGLAFEIALHVVDKDTLATMVGLVVLGRCWRFVRISHGIVELVHDWNHDEYNKLATYMDELESYATHLEEMLAENSIRFSEPPKRPGPPPLYHEEVHPE